jgi:hypothetical protein
MTGKCRATTVYSPRDLAAVLSRGLTRRIRPVKTQEMRCEQFALHHNGLALNVGLDKPFFAIYGHIYLDI